MSKPKLEVDSNNYIRDIHFLYEIFNGFDKTSDLKDFLKDILTPSELRMIKRRWHIASLLLDGNDIRRVASESHTSTQTVWNVKQKVENGRGGLKKAIKLMKAKLSKNENKDKGSLFVKGWFNPDPNKR